MIEPKYKDEQYLRHAYLEDMQSSGDIGRKFGVARGTVHWFMQKYNIPARSRSEAVGLAQRNFCDLTQDAKDFIYGELLGDMHMRSQGGKSAHIQYASKYRDYVEWLSATLKGYGVEQVGKIRAYKHSYNDKCPIREYYYYSSLTYYDLYAILRMFYPNGKKIIPENLNLSPLVLRQWYIGDGTVGRARQTPGTRDFIVLNTQGFNPLDVQMVTMKINDIGIRVAYQPANNVIAIKGCSVVDFLDYIGPCPIGCYAYKWATKNRNGQLEMPLKN